jgi:Ni/Fe-hydrogenase subunit HybB-like protein
MAVITRTRAFKDLLWFLALFGLVAAVFRLRFGLGATTNLSDMTPWGLWKILNMVAGVAISTSGFTVGFLVYVLGLERFRPFVKPAILIAFLGYGCSCLALLFDIGLPHRFWHPIFMWNINSFLFEVFWCVLLYFTVTAIELAPVILDRLKAEKAVGILHRIAFVVVVIGISLSSLHHSSLGSLFLVTPQRLQALWYTPWLPLFFIISAMGSGLMFAVFVKILWSWWYDRKAVFGTRTMKNIPLLDNADGIDALSKRTEGPQFPMVHSLASIAAGILAFYLLLKIVDLFVHGAWQALLAGTWESWLYIFELVIISVLPVTLMLLPGTRRSPAAIGIGAFSASIGLALNRMDVGIFGYFRDTGVIYFPSLTEWALGLGVIAAAALMFFFIAENLPIFSSYPPAARSRAGIFRQPFGTLRQIWNMVFMDSLHRVTLVAALSIPLAFILMYPPYHRDAASGERVKPSLGVNIERTVLKIDGNRRGVATIFDHADHQKRLGDSLSCVNCHHLSMPKDKSTPCSQCHLFMNDPAGIFNHDAHMEYVAEQESLGGVFPVNNSCLECHPAGSPKTAENAKNCLDCHKEDMLLADSLDQKLELATSVSFRAAMHRKCIECHTRKKDEVAKEMLDNCGTCHSSLKYREITEPQMVFASEK